eukprot:Amastigsp_a676338_231.p2 type:complete len:100 gc:universal Amastigsp_a676338_231:123-422(+)
MSRAPCLWWSRSASVQRHSAALRGQMRARSALVWPRAVPSARTPKCCSIQRSCALRTKGKPFSTRASAVGTRSPSTLEHTDPHEGTHVDCDRDYEPPMS